MNQFEWRKAYAAYVNLDHRHDRRDRMVVELARVGLTAERSRAFYPHEIIEPTKNFTKTISRGKGALGCYYSQMKVIKDAYNQCKSAFVLEDDLVFGSDVAKRLDYAQEFLNNNEWDIFWLGGTYCVSPPTWHDIGHTNPDLPDCTCTLGKDVEKTSDARIVRTYGCWSTYAYIVNYESIPKILELLENDIEKSYAIDFSFIKFQPWLRTFAFLPAMARQYDNESNIGIGISNFSHFSSLGQHWFKDTMEELNPSQIQIL